MGSSCSKNDRNKALLLCKERLRFIKQAVDLRYALSAAQLSYTQSLRNMGAALRQFAEAGISVDPSQSNFDSGQTPPKSSSASPSPFVNLELLCSSHGVPSSPPLSSVSYMRVVGSASVNFTVDTSPNHYVEEEGDDALTFPMPPPPPFPDIGSSWDFFDPVDAVDTIKIPNGEYAMRQHFGKFAGLRQTVPSSEGAKTSLVKELLTQDNTHQLEVEGSLAYKDPLGSKMAGNSLPMNNYNLGWSPELAKIKACCGIMGPAEPILGIGSPELCTSKVERLEMDRQTETEKEDSSKLVTGEAKDFLSSIKDVEHRFIRASESGHEVSRMLETKKIRLSVHSEILGKSSDSFLSMLHLLCCKANSVSEGDTFHNVTKIITWKRSVSSRSSSSRNRPTSTFKDDGAGNGDFVEEFSMISGSHSSTLDRLYAWERKLYDELKACESITKAYDRKCNQLRHQFAKDMNPRVIDKTRAAVKDLHSRVRVTIQAVDLISRRIEKLRDEELQPQLAELLQGLIRMWKAMLECHQGQFLTISSAYQAKNTSPPSRNPDSCKQAAMNLRNEIECFRSSFLTWIDTQKAYAESLNGWLQKCVLQPHERSRGRKLPFSPRRALAPPIFVLCRDWLAGIKPLPMEDVSGSLQKLITAVSEFLEHLKEDKQVDLHEDQKNEEERLEVNPTFTSLIRLKESMSSTFEWLVKFSEESVKVYEGVKQESQIARDAYASSGWFRL